MECEFDHIYITCSSLVYTRLLYYLVTSELFSIRITHTNDNLQLTQRQSQYKNESVIAHILVLNRLHAVDRTRRYCARFFLEGRQKKRLWTIGAAIGWA